MSDHTFDYTANISILFGEVDYLERPAAARAAGFSKVESWWPFPTPTPTSEAVDAVVDALAAAEVQLTGLNFYAGDMPGGERGIGTDPDRAEEFRSSLPALLELADRTGCKFFNLLYGQLNEHASEDDQHQSAIATLATGAKAVESFGGTVLLEPLAQGLNGNYPLLSLEDAFSITAGPLAKQGVTNVKPLFDLFHLGSNGTNLVQAARQYATRIGHVQVADSPGRGEPGTGQLPITETLNALVESGYAGVIGCEYKPTRDTTETLGWLTR